jgi:hypothetical protein
MAQPGGDSLLGSPRIEYSNECFGDGAQPGRLEIIRDDSNVNGNDEDARTRLVSDLIHQLTVIGRDGNIDPITHQRLIEALDIASIIPQPQPQHRDQNLFVGMNEHVLSTSGGLNQVDEEDKRRSYSLDFHNYLDARKNEPHDENLFDQPYG